MVNKKSGVHTTLSKLPSICSCVNAAWPRMLTALAPKYGSGQEDNMVSRLSLCQGKI